MSGQSCKLAGRRIQTVSCPQRSLDYQVQPLKCCAETQATTLGFQVSLRVPWSVHRILLTMPVTTCMHMLLQESSPCFSTQSQPAPTTEAASSLHFEEGDTEDHLISFIQVEQTHTMLISTVVGVPHNCITTRSAKHACYMLLYALPAAAGV